MKDNLFTKAYDCLLTRDVDSKLKCAQDLWNFWREGELDFSKIEIDLGDKCGIPTKPKIVPLHKLKHRKLDTKEGHAAMIHSIAHIEFSAINLALDAAARFNAMPKDYYTDWLRIADEERQHFSLLNSRLKDLGFNYGDFPAHQGLWQVAKETTHDVLIRMALVPRVLEARGLDVTPNIINKFEAIGDTKTVYILNRIFKDEITHVSAGSHWFNYVCKARGLDHEQTFFEIIRDNFKGKIQGPVATEARRNAGFSDWELKNIQRLADL